LTALSGGKLNLTGSDGGAGAAANGETIIQEK